jgi:hypothetical protein
MLSGALRAYGTPSAPLPPRNVEATSCPEAGNLGSRTLAKMSVPPFQDVSYAPDVVGNVG